MEFKPRWFDLTEEVTSTPWGDLEVYKYNGKYTEHRKLLDNSDTDKTNIEQLKSIMFNPWQFDSPADHVPHGNQVLAVNSKSTSLWRSARIAHFHVLVGSLYLYQLFFCQF